MGLFFQLFDSFLGKINYLKFHIGLKNIEKKLWPYYGNFLSKSKNRYFHYM